MHIVPEPVELPEPPCVQTAVSDLSDLIVLATHELAGTPVPDYIHHPKALVVERAQIALNLLAGLTSDMADDGV